MRLPDRPRPGSVNGRVVVPHQAVRVRHWTQFTGDQSAAVEQPRDVVRRGRAPRGDRRRSQHRVPASMPGENAGQRPAVTRGRRGRDVGTSAGSPAAPRSGATPSGDRPMSGSHLTGRLTTDGRQGNGTQRPVDHSWVNDTVIVASTTRHNLRRGNIRHTTRKGGHPCPDGRPRSAGRQHTRPARTPPRPPRSNQPRRSRRPRRPRRPRRSRPRRPRSPGSRHCSRQSATSSPHSPA